MLAESALDFLPPSSADALRAAARTVAGLRSNAPPDDLLVKLRAAKGVGEAAIEYVAMRALNDSDALPADLMELRADCDRAEGWKPWRAYGAMLLLCAAPAGLPALENLDIDLGADLEAERLVPGIWPAGCLSSV